ncbi:hypothetical protein ABBQ32_003696 [Trebouxia sp. C0010 RCD-2024]
MAAWLQKRLKDAEALLEQADRTAQRVVVKDKDNPKIPSTGVSAGPGAGSLATGRILSSKEPGRALYATAPVQVSEVEPAVSRGLPSNPAEPALLPPSVQTSAPVSTTRLPPINTAAKRSRQPPAPTSSAVQQIPFMTHSKPSQQQPPAFDGEVAISSASPTSPVKTGNGSPGAQSASSADTGGAEPVPSGAQQGPSGHNGGPIVIDGQSPKEVRAPTNEMTPSSPPAQPNANPSMSAAPASMSSASADDALQDSSATEDLPSDPPQPIAADSTQDQQPSAARSQPFTRADPHINPSSAIKQAIPFSSQASTDGPQAAAPVAIQRAASLHHTTAASSSGKDAMQSQASLPGDSHARAAAVAEAIKRASQASESEQAAPQREEESQASSNAVGREVRLSRVVEQLKGRLQTLREENQQLEEMLHQSDARASSSVREVERLEDGVSRAEAARLSAEASLAHSSTVQQGEVRSAQQALHAATKDLQDCQARLADLENTNALLIQEQQVSEGRIIAALRDEVTAAEVRLEEERAAHTSTQRAAAAREQALQSSMADGGSALGSMQRLVEERTQQALTAQQALMQLQQDHARLSANLQTAQEQAASRQGSESMEAQMQLQAEVDRWQQESNELSTALREAQAGREQAEVHLERLQGSLQDLQRHNQDRGNYDELQTRFKEVTELLYTKQTQLERMAAEKAAQQLAHEHQLTQARDDAERVKRRVKSERATSFSSTMDEAVVPMDSLGEAFDRLANDNRVGSYVKAGARQVHLRLNMNLLDAHRSHV